MQHSAPPSSLPQRVVQFLFGTREEERGARDAGAGFDRVEGPAVLAAIREPGPMVRFALEDIYR